VYVSIILKEITGNGECGCGLDPFGSVYGQVVSFCEYVMHLWGP
jgi:hypothetical protein